MSFNDKSWQNRKIRKYPRITRSCRRISWLYVVYGILCITNFNTKTINNDDRKEFYQRNAVVHFCLASELGEDTDIKRPITIRNRSNPSTVTAANSSELHVTQSAEPIKSKLKSQRNLETMSLNQIMYRAGKRGLGGGIPGAIAGAFQVLSLMWLRTIINYQSRYGTTFMQALRTLLNEGGIARLYCGVSFALIQAPLARFVSTAANDGVESLLANLSLTKDWGPGRTTVVASIVVGFWRMLLMRTFSNLASLHCTVVF